MASLDESAATRLRKEISRLHADAGREADKAAKAASAAAQARAQAAKATSSPTARSRLQEAERRERDATTAQQRFADIQKRIATKTKELHQREERISVAQSKSLEAQRKSVRSLEEELRRRESSHRANVSSQLQAAQWASLGGSPATMSKSFDFFVSHATPDKDDVARPLSEALSRRGAKVFFDEWEIRVGDSIRQRIDNALAQSRFGVVILSKAFLAGREWTERELNGLFALEGSGEPRILPIWHDVTKADVAKYSPMLADRAALKTADYTIEEIADLLVDRLGLRSESLE